MASYLIVEDIAKSANEWGYRTLAEGDPGKILAICSTLRSDRKGATFVELLLRLTLRVYQSDDHS